MADGRFLQEFLKTHNTYRTKHGAQLLQYNDELNAAAQQWADHLLAHDSFDHSETDDGENIFSMSGSGVTPTGKEVVDFWYSEIKDYNFSCPGYTGETAHFTQVVWKGTTELGVGLSTDGTKVYVVGQYRPPGNKDSAEYFEANVKAAGKDPGEADNSNSDGGGGGVRKKKTCTLL